MQKEVGVWSALCVYRVVEEEIVDPMTLKLGPRAAFFTQWCREKLVEYSIAEVCREHSWGPFLLPPVLTG